MSERLHKVLAQHGLGSRREIEKWIVAGRVNLNDRAAQPGDAYTEGDRVAIDGKDVTARLRIIAAPQVIMYHKAQGQPVTAGQASEDSEESADGPQESVLERLPAIRGARWLVINTMQPGDSGLLLLTTDGRLADALRRRAEGITSAYVARVLVPFPDYDIATLPLVVQYDDATIEFDSIEPAGGEATNRWFRVESHRAHRRAAVRALFESRGLKVSRIIQVRFAHLELPRDLPRGRHRALGEGDITRLYEAAQLQKPVAEVKTPTRARPHAKSIRHRSGGPRPATGKGRVPKHRKSDR
jgi:23S rRNA pseudouridine2605 synthase